MKVLCPRFSVALVAACVALAAAPAAFSQTAATDVAKYFVPRAPRLEGTITLLEDGVTSTATLQMVAADARLAIAGDEASGTPPRTVISGGQQTMVIDDSTKRTRLWRWNALSQPWRGQTIDAAGPANFWLGALDVAALQKAYTIGQSSKGNERTLELKARPEIGRSLVRDEIRAGGKGSGKFYAARKIAVWDRPFRIVLTLDAKTSAPISRAEFDARNRLISSTSFVDDAMGLPQSATTRDFNNRVLAQWRYDWKPRATDFDRKIFEIAAPEGQILEEAELQPPAKLTGADASSRWNAGVAQARLENPAAAFAAWDEAAQLAPQAVAPPMASFDVALQIRDTRGAASALQKIAALLGDNHLEVLSRRLQLAAFNHDTTAIGSALDAAVAAQPANLALRLRRAAFQRAFGDAGMRVAERDLIVVVNRDKAPPSLAVEGAISLASLLNLQGKEMGIPDDAKKGWPVLAALLQIGEGSAIAPDALQRTLGRLPDDRARAAVANGLEKAGRFEDAIGTWKGISERAAEPLWAEAQRHLMLLAALKGTPLESLRAYRELMARSDGEANARALQDALIAAWDKSLKRDALRSAIENRAVSTAATEDDARLWLAWLETYGSSDDLSTQISNAASRWPKSAWWQSRRAEILTEQAAVIIPGDLGAGRARVYNAALQAVDRAIALDPEQPYYAMQKSLITTRRATDKVPISDAGTRVAEREAAEKSLAAFAAQWPDDADARLSLAVQQLGLTSGKDVEAPIGELRNLLAGQRPLSPGESDWHPVLFTARLSLAAALRRAGRAPEAAAQYARLLPLSRTPAEYGGVALNALNFLDSQRDGAAVASLMERIVAEPWSFGDMQELMSQWVSTLAPRRPLLVAVRQSLAQSKTLAARLAAGYLDFAFLRLAQNAAAGEAAPIAAQAALRDAMSNWKIATADLRLLAATDDAGLAAQAAALTAQDALARGDSAAAATDFSRALALFPTDLDLRIALSRALADSKQADKVLSLRDESLKVLSPSANTLRWVAWMSGRGGDHGRAVSLGRAAFNLASANASDTGLWRDIAFTLARALSATNDFAASDALYEKLADKQWSSFDRATALLDWQERADATGRDALKPQIAARLQPLKLSASDLRAAQSFVRGLD